MLSASFGAAQEAVVTGIQGRWFFRLPSGSLTAKVQLRAVCVCPQGVTREKFPKEGDFCRPQLPPQLIGGSGACSQDSIPNLSPSSQRRASAVCFSYCLIQKRSRGGGVTLSRAQPALGLLTAQQRCLRTRIPNLSFLKAVKMYFLLCHFSFWQAGSQVCLVNVKVGNKVVH